MLSRLSAAAALLAAWLAVSPALHAGPAAGKMVRRVYPVADLVVPPPDVTCPAGSVKTDKAEKPRPTREDWLIELIQNTIEPATWAAKDGKGTIDYFPLGGCLVVNQTPEMHEQIDKLLADLRKQQETEIAFEVRIVTVADDDVERIGVDFNQEANGSKTNRQSWWTMPTDSDPQKVPTTFLNDVECRQFLEATATEQRTTISQSPRITLLNGQQSTTSIIDNLETENLVTGFTLTTLPNGCVALVPQVRPINNEVAIKLSGVVSADQKFVRLALEFEKKDLVSTEKCPVVIPVRDKEGNCTVYSQYLQNPTVSNIHFSKTVVVPDGGTVVFGGFKREVEVKTECAPPIVGRIPYLNRLFKNIGYGRETQRVFVLVTPRIVVPEEEKEERATGFHVGPQESESTHVSCPVLGTLIGCATHHPLPGAAIGAAAGAVVGAPEDHAASGAVVVPIAAPAPRALTFMDIAILTAHGTPDATIINQIRSRGVVSALDAEELLFLDFAHVSDAVIAEMQATATRPQGVLVQPVPAPKCNGEACPVQRTEVRFLEPNGMHIDLQSLQDNSISNFSTYYLEVPARLKFTQGKAHYLKLTDIPGHPGEAAAILDIEPSNARTAAFLAHNAVRLAFTEDDFKQLASNNNVVKVVYLPHSQNGDSVASEPETLTSSQLQPGSDVIAEAQRRGSILLVLRMECADARLLAESTQRQIDALEQLLKGYYAACAEGQPAEAKKFAEAALLLDPTCFSKKR